jgi:hypothetical protein
LAKRLHSVRLWSAQPHGGAFAAGDLQFRYRPSHATDVRETFARARRELEQAGASPAAADKVVQLKKTQPR